MQQVTGVLKSQPPCLEGCVPGTSLTDRRVLICVAADHLKGHCTPDLSHEEQLSVIVRMVSQEDVPQVKEHFLGFLVEKETTGESLTSLIQNRLEELNIPFEDCRGQSYDNGANMKGKNKAIWYDILNKIQHVSKVLPSPAMRLNMAVDLLKKTRDSLACYRNTGFSDAQTTAKEMCDKKNVEAVLKQQQLRNTKGTLHMSLQMSPLMMHFATWKPHYLMW
ncbi:hypothetical protein F2P81_021845 [Scophthalmus maximus]|uniref:DUF4371 domain-containing protein n=1 Tax=Scophthalmus maximus TaxID=52904 RepID=A0A6A4S356_SCOMX|nr:hypothetical protein F2P81_021845 [Scophthalmus maximus]